VRADPVPAEQAERAPDLRFDPLGGVEPFDVTVSGSGVAFALTVDDRGRIALAKVNHVAP
ncbi:MAG: hypothetical protein SFV21_08625, partial [Rhodospirillaceae bacterium]|nr:hypothetical protein [Rhodospirillaceae bacterium]